MPSSSRPLLEQITQSPLLINAASEGLLQSSIEHLAQSERAAQMFDEAVMSGADDDFWHPGEDGWLKALRPYNVANGVLQIPVMGLLLNRFPYQFGRWATGYTYIEKAMQRGLADGNVQGIAFIHDSPGGEVAGCFELVDKIFTARGQKPMRSFAADHAYSASYAIFSATGKGSGSITRSGGVGSIGVVTAHVEYSEMLKAEGIKVTLIYAGEHKVDGNAYEKLPDSVKSRIQERVDRIYGEFTSTVARNRGMDGAAVRDTKALTYDAAEAIDVGLADRIGALDEEMAIFSEGVAAAEDEQMAQENSKPADTGDTVDKAAHDAAVADATLAGAVAERTRIKAILACDESKDRPKSAMSCALNTDMSFELAKAFLAELPKEKAEVQSEKPSAATASKRTPFEEAMDASGNPNVGADSDDDEEDDGGVAAAASILRDYAGAAGRKPKK